MNPFPRLPAENLVVEHSSPTRALTTDAIATRLRSIRADFFGEDGVADFATRLGIPSRTWLNYENGVTIPGDLLLRFLVLTGVEPFWLLSGEGPRLRVKSLAP